jgi:ribose transport system permease protein
VYGVKKRSAVELLFLRLRRIAPGTAGLALAVFSVITGVAQMFVITLGPGNVDPSLPANIGLASAVAMKVMNGSDAMIAAGLLASLASGVGVGLANYLLIFHTSS